MPEALTRSIRLPHATALVIGIIVGASIFVQPSEVSRLVPGVWGMLLVWIAAGVLTLVGALVCADLAYRPSFRLPLAPWLPGLFALVCAAIVVQHVVAAPIESLAGLAIVAIGLPVYAFRRPRAVRPAQRSADARR